MILTKSFVTTLRQLHLNGTKKDMDKPGNNRRLNGKFRGMVLERLSGKTLAEELAARRSSVQDVHFLREVLYQVRQLPLAHKGSLLLYVMLIYAIVILRAYTGC